MKKSLIVLICILCSLAAWSENIVFADAKVKALCVANWDTNSDGELSTEEAAAVTDLGTVFNNKTTITSFDELSYFTGLTSISNEAFYGCTGLTSITIPNSVTSIAGSAFFYCSSLTSITIPNSVTTIGNYAFCYCSGLTSVTIPNSVTSIGQSAFDGCSDLTSITIPNSVTSIGNYVFSRCSGLTSISVESGNTVYDSRGNCNAIIKTSSNQLIAGCKNTAIPNSVTSIGNNAFSKCSGLTSVTIPNSVTSIGGSAFSECSGLTSVICLAENVPTTSSNAFSYIQNATLLVPAGSVAAYQAAAPWSSFGNIMRCDDSGSCGDNVTCTFDATTGTLTISGTGAMTDYTFDSSAPWFSYKSAIKTVVVTNGVTSIGNYAFYGCSGLTSVTIPNSVTSIGQQAFLYCSGLTSITIPNSVTSIGQSAFEGCSGLTSITVESGNTVYDSRENCNAIIKTSTNGLIAGCMNTVIPNSVTSIGDGAFYDCSGLTSVTIPGSVTSIGQAAFSGCSGLTSVTIPGSVTSIGPFAFGNCI